MENVYILISFKIFLYNTLFRPFGTVTSPVDGVIIEVAEIKQGAPFVYYIK